MLNVHQEITLSELQNLLPKFWELSGEKIKLIEKEYDFQQGSPVFTVQGKYSTRGWTEWTQGFQYGSSILQYDATGDADFLEMGRESTRKFMAAHVGHFGVHDHGFNNVSTYGNLLRLMKEGKIAHNPWEKDFYELALKLSGAVQARRWTEIKDGGFIHSFNGPHSLFVDTIRTVQRPCLSVISWVMRFGRKTTERSALLARTLQHAEATAKLLPSTMEREETAMTSGAARLTKASSTQQMAIIDAPILSKAIRDSATWTRGLGLGHGRFC